MNREEIQRKFILWKQISFCVILMQLKKQRVVPLAMQGQNSLK